MDLASADELSARSMTGWGRFAATAAAGGALSVHAAEGRAPDSGPVWASAILAAPEQAFRLDPPRHDCNATPAAGLCGVVFASPHSGRYYPPELLSASARDLDSLRRFEDAFVDHLFDAAPANGAFFIQALYARAFVDLNRAADEIDPEMLADQHKCRVFARSQRVMAGLGVVPKLAPDGRALYRNRLAIAAIDRRIECAHAPFHAALAELLECERAAHSNVLLLDCHSMPAAAGGREAPDIVIGDRYGHSAGARVVGLVESLLRDLGFRVARNAPYAGGHITSLYGRPALARHAVQIEVNRALYMDETSCMPSQGFASTRRRLGEFVAGICAHWPRMAQIRR